ncbi:MAG: sugar transferase [Oscillospiraceae bacterium]|nr:sugar transferase [Oscillospiraceae bacterium]MBQ7129791.1 sugar transferase [Oscillospiraceae bacterium]
MGVYERFGKRMMDISLSLLGLVLLSPLLLLLAAVGTVAFSGNPLFTQLRPGRAERFFRLVKFRSMTDRRDSSGTLLPDEMRLTAYGRFLRKTSLDELPELWNILLGEMSLVGPRPQLVRDMVFMTPQQRQRHRVRPGLTGLAQVNGRNGITWEEKLEFDRKYLEKITFRTDVRILLQTLKTVLSREGIGSADRDTAEDLGDWLLQTGQISPKEYRQKQKSAAELPEKEAVR